MATKTVLYAAVFLLLAATAHAQASPSAAALLDEVPDDMDYLVESPNPTVFPADDAAHDNTHPAPTNGEPDDLTAAPTPSPTPEETPAALGTCVLVGTETVSVGWKGPCPGDQFCNLCKCESDGSSLVQLAHETCGMPGIDTFAEAGTYKAGAKVCTHISCAFVACAECGTNPDGEQIKTMQITHLNGDDEETATPGWDNYWGNKNLRPIATNHLLEAPFNMDSAPAEAAVPNTHKCGYKKDTLAQDGTTDSCECYCWYEQ